MFEDGLERGEASNMLSNINVETLLIALIASSGFWAVITVLLQHFLNRKDKTSEEEQKMNKLVIGLGHDRICILGMAYIERGYITKDEYEDLITYLYTPYKELGGNGTAELVIDKVKKLPVKANSLKHVDVKELS